MTLPHEHSPEQLGSAKRLLSHFPNSMIQYFDDTPERDQKKALCTSSFNHDEALLKQLEGCGVYWTPNAFEGKRQKSNLLKIQAVYIDIDLAKEGDGTDSKALAARKNEALTQLIIHKYPPHFIIQTKHGLQAIWKVKPLDPDAGLRPFADAEKSLITTFKADSAAKDVTRVLRLPDYQHLKDPANPFLCTLAHELPLREAYDIHVFTQIDPVKDKDAPSSPPSSSWNDSLSGVKQGSRHASATSMCGKIIGTLDAALWDSVGWDGLLAWNCKNDPPLPTEELRRVFDDITKSERKKTQEGADEKERRSQAVRILELITEENCFLFHDQHRDPHAAILIGSHRENVRISGRSMKRWLGHLMWESEGTALNREAGSAVMNVLESKAIYHGPRHELHNRVAAFEEGFLYDLCNENNHAVFVNRDGWKIIEPPIIFRRYAHQNIQPTPVESGDLRELLSLIRLADQEQGVLLLTYLVTCLIPNIPHPILNLYGPHGAAKTTTGRMLRRLIDPSSVEVLSFPSKAPEIVQQLAHHYFPIFDNIGDISDTISDLLCRAVTGEGYVKRELFSDDEDFIYSFRRCVGLTGINPAARKPDLLDRSLLIKLDRIPEDQRREDSSVLQHFETLRPRLFGAMLTALSKAMTIYEFVDLPKLPRMADFTRWGCAVALALGYEQDDFLKAYYRNIREQHHEAIQESPIATAVQFFMRSHAEDEWRGSASQLLPLLDDVATSEHLDRSARDWPKRPNTLSRRINEAKVNLEEVGIFTDVQKLSGGQRVIVLRRSLADTAQIALPPAAANNSGKGKGDIQSGLFSEVKGSITDSSQQEAIGRYGDAGDISSHLHE